MENFQNQDSEGAKKERSMTLIDKYEEDYKNSLASINTEVKELIENGREMKAIMLFAEKLSKITEIHESLNNFYAIILSNLEVLKHFNSERLRQLGHAPVLIGKQLENEDFDPEFLESYVVKELSKIGFKKTHWWIKTRILTEIEYLIETLRILIEPEFIPFEEAEGVETDQEKQDRHIPSSVKIAVWSRDGGKCVECGSKEKLEYDHIIPLSKGGSNTERNIQLLCEKCNRKKAANIE